MKGKRLKPVSQTQGAADPARILEGVHALHLAATLNRPEVRNNPELAARVLRHSERQEALLSMASVAGSAEMLAFLVGAPEIDVWVFSIGAEARAFASVQGHQCSSICPSVVPKSAPWSPDLADELAAEDTVAKRTYRCPLGLQLSFERGSEWTAEELRERYRRYCESRRLAR